MRIAARLPRLLDAQLKERGRLTPTMQSIELNISPLSTCSISLSDASQVSVRDFIEVYTGKGTAGKFRVTAVERAGQGETSRIQLEHGICTLEDALIPGEGRFSGTFREVIGMIFTHQSTGVNGTAMWTLGDVEADGTIDYAYADSNTLQALIDVMGQLPGYMLEFDQSSFPWVAHIREKETNPFCEGRLGRNIQTARITLDDSELCTRLYCTKFDGGYMQLEDSPKWGIVSRSLSVSEDIDKNAAVEYGRRYLQERQQPMVSVEIDGIELVAQTNEKLDDFRIGRMMRLALPDYGMVVNERIVALSYLDTVGQPEMVRISLANQLSDTSSRLAGLLTSTNKQAGYIRQTERQLTNLADSHEEWVETTKGLTHKTTEIEIDMDAVKATLDLKASQTQVDEQDAILKDTLIRLDAANAEILLKASVSDLEAQGELISEAYVRIDGLESEVEIKADRIELNGYVTANQLETKFTQFESGISDALYVSALSANGFECSTFSFKGNPMSLKSAAFLNSNTTLTVNATGGTVTGVTMNKKTSTIYYMSWE
ncbi:MAG: phage tail protein [Oscillospiraceae bacterium]|nr:phage tail protein [Oscillospiraceae bacterium]